MTAKLTMASTESILGALNQAVFNGKTGDALVSSLASQIGLVFNQWSVSAKTFTLAGGVNETFGLRLEQALPKGSLVPIAMLCDLTITSASTAAFTSSEIGMGSVQATGNHATLGAAGATAEDIMEGVSGGALVAGSTALPNVSGAWRPMVTDVSTGVETWLNGALGSTTAGDITVEGLVVMVSKFIASRG